MPRRSPLLAAAIAAVAGAAVLLFFLWGRGRRGGDGSDGGVPSADEISDADRPRSPTPGAIEGPPRPDPNRAPSAPPPAGSPTSAAGAGDPTARWVVSGTVVAAGVGAPLRGARLAVATERHPENLGSTEGSGPTGLASITTDPDGTFRLALDAGPPTPMTVTHPDGRPP
jgi:hypothetical protein